MAKVMIIKKNTEAKEKISADLESLEFFKMFGMYLTEFKNYTNLTK